MNGKAPDAFRTISEVAEWLGVNAHVLRFWESKFSQVKPVKRAGGRRYYRPSDMELLGGIQKLLHEDGMTIKGVQKILREKGVRAVCAMSKPVDADGSAPDGAAGTHETGPAAAPAGRDSAPVRPEEQPAAPPRPESAEPPLHAAASGTPAPDLRSTAEAEPPDDQLAEGRDEDDALPLFGHSASRPEPAVAVPPAQDDVAPTAQSPGNVATSERPNGQDAPSPSPPDTERPLAEALAGLSHGRIDPGLLRPIHAGLLELRERMDARG